MSVMTRSRLPKLLAVVVVAMVTLAVYYLVSHLGGPDATTLERPGGGRFAGTVVTVGVLGAAIAAALVILIQEVTDRL
jgi:hypothetical protein